MDSARVQTFVLLLLGFAVGCVIVAVSGSIYMNFFAPDQEAAIAPEVVSSDGVGYNTASIKTDESSQQSSEVSSLDREDLLNQSQFGRTSTLHRYLLSADVELVEDFLEQSFNIDPMSLRREMQEAAIGRLANLDPEKALRQINDLPSSSRSSLIKVAFDVWSANDLNEALTHASALPQRDQRSALDGIFLSMNAQTDSERKEVARLLSNDWVVADVQAMEMAGEPLEDPAIALHEFLDEYGGDARGLGRSQLALLQHIVDTWVVRGVAADLANAISSALQDRDNESAVQFLLETLVRSDPSMAVQATSSIDVTDQRTSIQEAVLAAWIELDPLDVLDSEGLIPIELQEWTTQQALIALSETSPSDAAARLVDVPNAGSKSAIARGIVTNWARLDPRAAYEWVGSDPEIQDYRWGLVYRIVEEVSKVEPGLALEWALKEPVSQQAGGRGMEITVIRNVALQGNYDTAFELVEKARDVENQQWSYVSIGQVLVSRGKSDEAWESLEKIPERFSLLYNEQVASSWAWSDPDTAFETFETLPKVEMREAVARSLFHHNQITHMYSKKKMQELKKHLPDWLQTQLE